MWRGQLASITMCIFSAASVYSSIITFSSPQVWVDTPWSMADILSFSFPSNLCLDVPALSAERSSRNQRSAPAARQGTAVFTRASHGSRTPGGRTTPTGRPKSPLEWAPPWNVGGEPPSRCRAPSVLWPVSTVGGSTWKEHKPRHPTLEQSTRSWSARQAAPSSGKSSKQSSVNHRGMIFLQHFSPMKTFSFPE